METTKSLKQTLAILLAYLWILCLFYHPIYLLEYTFFGSFIDALFNYSVDFSCLTRLILALPMLSLIVVTVLIILQRRGRHSIRNWHITVAMIAAISIHSAYHSTIIWGQDVMTIFLTYYLDIEHDTLTRIAQWVIYEDFWKTHWFNVIMPFCFKLCLLLYRRLIKREAAERPAKHILEVMPPIPSMVLPNAISFVPAS